MRDDFLAAIRRRLERARSARPDVPDPDLLFAATGDERAMSYDELNARGEPTRFLCLAVEELPDPFVVEGSSVRACADCGAPLWISPATLEVFTRVEGARIVCLDCAGL